MFFNNRKTTCNYPESYLGFSRYPSFKATKIRVGVSQLGSYTACGVHGILRFCLKRTVNDMFLNWEAAFGKLL